MSSLQQQQQQQRYIVMLHICNKKHIIVIYCHEDWLALLSLNNHDMAIFFMCS